METLHPDMPYSLANLGVHDERVSMLGSNHVAPLTKYVDQLKQKLGPDIGMPYFDPLDGGINARLLFVLETPGPKAVGTNFVSRNNPDPTARNTFKALEIAGLEREDTVLWNIVPWNVSTTEKNRNSQKHEVLEGIPYLLRVIDLFPNLEAIVLCGGHAKKATDKIREATGLKIFETYHLAGQSYNHKRLRDHINQTLAAAAQFIYQR